MTLPAAILVLSAAAGLCAGSYATTAALRQTQGRGATWGRSRCDHCGVSLGFLATAPVVSFVHRRGACTDCGGTIDPLHVVGELVGAGLALSAVAFAAPVRALPLTVLGLLLLFSAAVDAKSRRLPDWTSLAIAALGAGLAATTSTATLLTGLASALVVFVVLELVRRSILRGRGQPGLGFGDVKLLAVLSIWTGLYTSWVVALAAVLALAVVAVRRPVDGRIAFGPFIAIGAWIVGLGMEAQLWPAL